MYLKDYLKYRSKYIFTVLAQQEQFAQWLRKLFFLNHELHTEYNSFYQEMFYIVFHQLITEGLEYIDKVILIQEKSNNEIKYRWTCELQQSLKLILSQLSESELDYIEYKRHNACHIFQNQYECQILKNGKLKDSRKDKKIEDLDKEFDLLLDKYGDDKGFDLHITSLLYPLLIDVYLKLQKIHAKEEQ